MLKNYFKIAIAVLKRRKFFTFISLFGISFTLTILIVATAFVDNTVSANYPETARAHSLYITTMQQKSTKKPYYMNGPMSFSFIERYVKSLKTPQHIAVSSLFTPTNTYVNNKKLVIDLKFTNGDFWNVLQFHFLQGKPYTQQQIENGERVAVISEETRLAYFGDDHSVVGKFIEADNVRYKVMGVVKSVPVTMVVSYADLYVPYTASKADLKSKGYMGNYTAVLLARSKADLPKIQEEYSAIVSKIPPENKEMDIIVSHADKYLASFFRETPLAKNGGVQRIIAVVIVFVLLFMLLPTLNLVNINISRIMERSSEIGVRKAFGASSGTLVGQFIVENLILTCIGTAIGVLLSFIVLQYINRSGLIENIHLTINFTVLLYSVVACIVFGLLSGVYPAWRMSRLQVVSALKA